MSSFLSVADLRVSVGGGAGREILRGVSFEVAEGEFVVVAGPNGAGKSTLLKCLCRILTGGERLSGVVSLEGVPVPQMSQRELARRVAYLPQMAEPAGFAAAKGFTARQLAAQGRYPWKRPFEPDGPEDRRLVEDALGMSGALDFADRDMASLSGGERQRALMAAALAQDAPLLLLDEPTTYLDYRCQVEMLELIRAILHGGEGAARRRTILAVTHDLNFAIQAADRLIVLSEGRVAWQGGAAELADTPGLLERFFETGFCRFPTGGIPFVAPARFFAGAPAEVGR